MRDLAVKEESLRRRPGFLFWHHFAGVSGGQKRTALDHIDRGPFGIIMMRDSQPPSVSSVSLTVLRIQVKIGVSRNV